jgi:flagella basal body P-ring formation protein FlgA
MTVSLMILAAAMPFADLDAIDRAASQFAGNAIGVEGGPIAGIDRRLRLAPCASTYAISWFNDRQETVVVQCPDAGWRVFVPVRRSAIEASAPAVSRGDSVTISVEGEGFAVSQPGEALDSGAVGAWIRVRRSGAVAAAAQAGTMRGRIVRPGVVALDLP